MREYTEEFRKDAVKLAESIGRKKASKELGVPDGTLSTWIHRAKNGEMKGLAPSPQKALTMAEEIKRLQKENKELRETNEILAKATAFFAKGQKK